MKGVFITGSVLLLLLSSCAVERHYVGPPRSPEKKLIILPYDRKTKPYVVRGVRYYPLPKAEGFRQRGKASWYGKAFHGRPTASGEPFDMYKISAAHKTLPLGTCVRVTNLSNGKEVVVRINDRGPFIKGRVIDLSYAAAREIRLVGPGVTDVVLLALGREVGKIESPLGTKPVVEIEDLESGLFTIQVGAFKGRRNALLLADRLKVIFEHVEVSVYRDGQG